MDIPEHDGAVLGAPAGMLPDAVGEFLVDDAADTAVRADMLVGDPGVDGQARAELERVGAGVEKGVVEGVEEGLGGHLGGLGASAGAGDVGDARHRGQAVRVVGHDGGSGPGGAR
jgi:hypothetical protein